MEDLERNAWVTILTPINNGLEFLEQCAMSVFQQKIGGWIWIIGVNGHGLSGGEVYQKALELQRIAKNHVYKGSVVVLNLPTANSKVEALNSMARSVKTEWVALLDCDDTWEPTKLALQFVAAKTYAAEADIIGTYCYYFGDICSNGPSLPAGWIHPKSMGEMNPIINSSALVRTGKAKWIDVFGLEDYDLWIRIAKAGGKLYVIPQHLVHHRIHNGSAFNGKGKQDVNGLLTYHGLVKAGHI